MARRDLDTVKLKAERADKARAELIEAILRARESGETYRDIGKAAGLSHARIVQLVQEHTTRETPSVLVARARMRLAEAQGAPEEQAAPEPEGSRTEVDV